MRSSRPIPLNCARAVLLASNPGSVHEDEFFSRLVLPNRTFKTTHRGRLADVDRWLLDRLAPDGKAIRVLDVAVSSGVTTADLIRLLRSRAAEVHTVATDLTMFGRILSFTSEYDVLLDGDDMALELRTGSVLRVRPHDLRSARRLLAWMGISFIGVCARLARVVGLGRSQSVVLLSQSLRGETHVELRESNVFETQPDLLGGFDLVRAANILNRAYFDDEHLRTAIYNLAQYLKPSGYLLIVRSEDSLENPNRASLFQRNAGPGLSLVGSLNGGSEIEGLALSL